MIVKRVKSGLGIKVGREERITKHPENQQRDQAKKLNLFKEWEIISKPLSLPKAADRLV